MRTLLIKIVLAAGILLAYALTASCSMLEDNNDSSSSGAGPGSSSSGGGNQGGQGNAPFNPNSQVYILTSFDGIPTVFNGGGNIIAFYNVGPAGNVTNGVVNLNLPQTITLDDDEYSSVWGIDLLNIDEEDISQYCTEHDDVGGIFRISYFMLYDSDEADYSIGSMYIEDAYQPTNDIVYVYFKRAGKITCNVQGKIISINAVRGLNTIYRTYESDGEYSTLVGISTSNILTNAVQWRLYDFSEECYDCYDDYYGD